MNIDELEEPGSDTALTKRDLVTQISKETGITQLEVYSVIQKALDGIIDALDAGKHVEFREFGVFEVTQRKARIGRNPQTGAAIKIKAKTVVKFRVAKAAKDVIAPTKK